MRRRRVLFIPVCALALVVVPGAALEPAAADPPEIATGTIQVDPTSFVITRLEPSGPVSRFSLDFRATTSGDLAGTLIEHHDCLRVGDVVRCRGFATTTGADGSTGTVRSRLVCTPLLACEGTSQGRGVTADGERLLWMSTISTPGDGTGTYVARVVRGG